MKLIPSNLYILYISNFFVRYIMQVQDQCCSNEAVEIRADGYCFPSAGQRMAQLTKHSV